LKKQVDIFRKITEQDNRIGACSFRILISADLPGDFRKHEDFFSLLNSSPDLYQKCQLKGTKNAAIKLPSNMAITF
jgi:hypothetical protein